MSPTWMNRTSRPTSMTSPVISCPRIKPDGAVVRPRTICWSDPQMLVEMKIEGYPPDVCITAQSCVHTCADCQRPAHGFLGDLARSAWYDVLTVIARAKTSLGRRE